MTINDNQALGVALILHDEGGLPQKVANEDLTLQKVFTLVL